MPLHRQPPKRRSQIAAQGNAAVRAAGLIYKFNSETAKAAGLKSAEVKRLKKMRKEQAYEDELNRLRTLGRR